ncbi:hypothetical protein A2U01_0033287 [Trifolium medium]|uniref:Uncharacterized protein n=1 Tax=Trifolium medium TaxID=97028 RepID=A0A392PK39_9FABA|nr:hypothetical protein [Trifolium medium]
MEKARMEREKAQREKEKQESKKVQKDANKKGLEKKGPEQQLLPDGSPSVKGPEQAARKDLRNCKQLMVLHQSKDLSRGTRKDLRNCKQLMVLHQSKDLSNCKQLMILHQQPSCYNKCLLKCRLLTLGFNIGVEELKATSRMIESRVEEVKSKIDENGNH